ncbi:MAG: hypothetical protein ACTSP4_11595 [Candidatus Hodarchaeales archaeon]
MGFKEMFAKIGLISIIFMLFLVVINDQGNIWANLSTVDVALANGQSLQLLWTGLVAATLLQGFVVFAALLGANLQFTPVKETHGDDH